MTSRRNHVSEGKSSCLPGSKREKLRTYPISIPLMHSPRKILSRTVFRTAFLLIAVFLSPTTLLEATTPTPVPIPPSYPKAPGLNLSVNGSPVPVLRVALNKGHHEVFDVASFNAEGSARVLLGYERDASPVPAPQTGETSAATQIPAPASTVVLPAGMAANLKDSANSASFDLDRPRQLHITLPGRRTPLLLFANPVPKMPEPSPGAGTVDVVSAFHADPTGGSDSTAAIQKAIDDVSAKGGGTVLLPPGLFRAGKLALRDKVRLHLAGGAALKFPDYVSEGFDYEKGHKDLQPGLYFISITGTHHAAITGNGMIDCNGESVKGPDGKRRYVSAIGGTHADDLSLEGITIIDGSSWTVVPAFCSRLLIRDIKIVNSLLLYENDGIDPVSCRDVLVDHCFVLATDDAFCPKPGGVGTHGGGVKPGPATGLRDVLFNDCTAWTRAAGCKVGRQSATPALNVVFKNSRILACSRGCAVDHDGGAAPFRNILFQGLEIDRYGSPFAVESKDPGPIRDITYQSLSIGMEKGKMKPVRFEGNTEAVPIEGVRIIDCTVRGEPVVPHGASPLRIEAKKAVGQVTVISRVPAPQLVTLMAVWGSNPEEGSAGKPLASPVSVLVTDRENRPIKGVEVTFAVESGGGSVPIRSAVSDDRGVATAGCWTLGKEPGENTLVAACPKAPGSHVVFMTKGVSHE